jgi:hypothetical protein
MNPRSTAFEISTLTITPLMNPRSTAFETSTLTITRVSVCLESGRSWVHRWGVSILVSKAVDRGFIGGVMVSFLVSKVVDHGFIGGVLVSVLFSKAVDRGFICRMLTPHRWTHDLPLSRQTLTRADDPTIYRFRDKHTNHYTTDEPMIYMLV